MGGAGERGPCTINLSRQPLNIAPQLRNRAYQLTGSERGTHSCQTATPQCCCTVLHLFLLPTILLPPTALPFRGSRLPSCCYPSLLQLPCIMYQPPPAVPHRRTSMAPPPTLNSAAASLCTPLDPLANYLTLAPRRGQMAAQKSQGERAQAAGQGGAAARGAGDAPGRAPSIR